MRPLLLAATLLCSASGAQAVTLVVGDNALPGTTSAAEPQLAGIVVADDLVPFTLAGGAGTYHGVVQNSVVLAVDGTYDFYWRIRDTSFTPSGVGAPFAFNSLRLVNFGAAVFAANGNFRVDSPGSLGPNRARVFPDPEGDVNFIFDGAGLAAGRESLLFFLDTNARGFARTAYYNLTSNGLSGISDNYAAYAPAAVPEPASWAMMIAGFGLVGGAMRRRARVSFACA